MVNYYDAPLSLPLIYPRALLIINGGKDGRCPIDGLYKCISLIMRLYNESENSI